MIDYERTNWYGIFYLCAIRGVLLPRLVPPSIVAAVISGIIGSEAIEAFNWCPEETDESSTPLFGHPYAFQLFGLVFGYMCIARLCVDATALQ